jgi:hypothetical protein
MIRKVLNGLLVLTLPTNNNTDFHIFFNKDNQKTNHFLTILQKPDLSL